uniref:NAD-dependent protein deacylase ) n=1 Tax=Ganoderma boninense TaxID=34458 RepID=A0A5K1K5N0_9APHY|nr:NAD-dependent protein deacylase (EC (Regulatory protein SIR2 homolog) [Ganoderma boninense]
MLTAEFTEAVDALIQDTSLPNNALNARARRYLKLVTDLQLRGPPWAARIQTAIPKVPAFCTLQLIASLYAVADELKLVAGKRYVSATICVCGDRTIPAAMGAPEGQSITNLVQALDAIASTWAAFLLWPFYVHGADRNLNSSPGDPQAFSSGPPPQNESEWVEKHQLVRDQQRREKEQVMARDNYYCFMCGQYDTDWFFKQQPEPPDGADFNDCDVVRIIKREVLAQDEGCSLDGNSLNIMHGILKRYFSMNETLLEKAEGPRNMLFVNTSACTGFRKFQWCLSPTKTPNRYKIKRYGPRNYAGSRHVTSCVSFVDHSQSLSPSQPPHPSPSPSRFQSQARARAGRGIDTEPVDLPDPALLRLHAALAGVLCLSGADLAFDCLLARPPWLPGCSRWPAPRGAAFWASVVEYEGEETCLEVDLDLSVEALLDDMRARAVAAGDYEARPAATNSREGSPSRH